MPQVRELNSGVVIEAASELTDELVLQHDIVVFTEGARRDLQRFNHLCRNRTVKVGRRLLDAVVLWHCSADIA